MRNPFDVLTDYCDGLIGSTIIIYLAHSKQYDEKFPNSKLTPKLVEWNKEESWIKYYTDVTWSEATAKITEWDLDYDYNYLCIIVKFEHEGVEYSDSILYN